MALSFEDDINPLVSLYLTDEEVRWTKEARVVWLNDAIRNIRKMRGDSRLDDWDDVEYEKYTIAVPKELILRDIFLDDIVNYIVWKCYLMDSQDEFNVSQARVWEATFKRGMGVI
jgi:hypothetical protein